MARLLEPFEMSHLGRKAAPFIHALHERELYPNDLRGLRALLYDRISSLRQRKGSGLDRQGDENDRVVADYGLMVDQRLQDIGKSAIKMRHVTDGELGALLTMIEDGTITPENPVVFLTEDVDRLVRSGQLDAFPILTKLIADGGLIVVFARDRTIWNRHAVNGPMGILLSALINRAYEEGKRLVSKAKGAHEAKRKLMEGLMDNPKGKQPRLAGRRPGWIVWEDGEYKLHPKHTATVRYVFDLCKAGMSSQQIAYRLNREKVPVLGDVLKADRKYNEWRHTAVIKLLRDQKTRGFVQMNKIERGVRVAVGEPTKLYPAVVKDAVFFACQQQMDGRRVTRGPRGANVPNLFTGKIFCGACGAIMRCDTAGEKYRPGRTRMYQCSSSVEARTCEHRQRYPIPYWERLIVDQIITHSGVVKRTPQGTNEAANRLATMQIELKQLEQRIAEIEPEIDTSKTKKARWDRWCQQADELAAEVAKVTLATQMAQTSVTRHKEVVQFLRDAVEPALDKRDPEARDRLRGLLSAIDFKVTFDHGLVDIRVGDWSDVFRAE